MGLNAFNQVLMAKICPAPFVLVLISFLIWNCEGKFESSEYREAETIYQESGGSTITIDSFFIGFEAGYRPLYRYKSFFYGQVEGTPVIALYNYVGRVIDVFSLKTRKIEKQIPVPKELAKLNPLKKVDDNFVSSIFIQSYDSVFLLLDFGLALIGQEGKVLGEWNLNYPDGMLNKEVVLRNNGLFPLLFDAKNKQLFVHGFCNRYSTYSQKFFNSPIEYRFDLNAQELSPLPVTYPDLFETGFFSATINPARIIRDSFHIYSFKIDPNIYLLNTRNGSVQVAGGRSRYQDREPKPFSRTVSFNKNKEIEYLKTIPYYERLSYDPYRHRYLRFFKNGQDETNGEGRYNTENDKPEYLMIFDEEFRVLSEIPLDPYKYFSFFSFVTEEGLAISDQNPENRNSRSDGLGFYLIRFQDE